MFILPISDEKKKIVLHVEQMQNEIALQVVQGLDSFYHHMSLYSYCCCDILC